MTVLLLERMLLVHLLCCSIWVASVAWACLWFYLWASALRCICSMYCMCTLYQCVHFMMGIAVIVLVTGAPYLHAVHCRLLAGHPVGHWRDYLSCKDVTTQDSMSLCLPLHCCKGTIIVCLGLLLALGTRAWLIVCMCMWYTCDSVLHPYSLCCQQEKTVMFYLCI